MAFAPDFVGDRAELYATIATNTALLPPDQRVELIQRVDHALMADEGSIRERAQLLAMRRQLVDADAKLRRAKR
jgi:hypothetical protein